MAWTRQERIDLLRGILQFLGIMVMVACIVMVIKYRDILFSECGWREANGTSIRTGLYGNCAFLDRFNIKNKDTQTGDGNQMPREVRR
jgi:hypothetical protein